MLLLVPKWAHHYDEFWNSIRRRNLWFIKLRYLAVLMLFGFLLSGEYILDFQFSDSQVRVIIISSILILFYNVLIHSTRKFVGCNANKFNCMHLSLIQMILDLIMLMLLVYYTGGIHSPLFMFFIFHMIIGSMILPGYVVFSICIIVVIVYSSMIFLQYHGILDSHIISGLFPAFSETSFAYLILFTVVFNLTLLISVLLANTIARRLYQREKELHESLIKLNEQEIAKQKYIIGLVHEIKTPLAAVESILELALQKFLGPISEIVEEKLTRAKIRSHEAIMLINNVLRISKLKLMNVSVHEPIEVNELIAEVIDQKSEDAKSKGIIIVFNNRRKNKNTVQGDKVLLELAFSNVLGNAIKYMEEKGKVEIDLSDSESGATIEICDNGIGIPEKDIDKIFNQFVRASNIKHKNYDGSGLGLSLVKEIIERHNGSIRAESPSRLMEQGRPGSSFIIFLPYIYTPEL